MQKSLNKKYLIISVIVVIFIIIAIIFLIIKPTKSSNTILTDYKVDLKQEDITLKEDITISNFSVRYYAEEKQWFLEMVFVNNTAKELSLENYDINAYDNNDNIVKVINGKALGKLSPNEKRGLTIESKRDISSVTKVLIEEKK